MSANHHVGKPSCRQTIMSANHHVGEPSCLWIVLSVNCPVGKLSDYSWGNGSHSVNKPKTCLVLHITWEWKEVQCWYWHHCLLCTMSIPISLSGLKFFNKYIVLSKPIPQAARAPYFRHTKVRIRLKNKIYFLKFFNLLRLIGIATVQITMSV